MISLTEGNDMIIVKRTFSYYRKHIPNFAMIARNLFELCKADTVFEMTQERLQSYILLREKLTKAPILLMPKWDSPLKLIVDACLKGLEAALHQAQIINDGPVEGPVVFIILQC